MAGLVSGVGAIKSAAEFACLQELLADVFERGTSAQAKELAWRRGISLSNVYAKASKDCPDKNFTLADLEAMIEVYQDPRILDFLARRMNHAALPLPEAEGRAGRPDRFKGQAVRDLGRLIMAEDQARAEDGPAGRRLAASEKSNLLGQSDEVLKTVMAYQRHIQHEPAAEDDGAAAVSADGYGQEA